MTMAGTGFYSVADIIALLNYGGLDLPLPTFSVGATSETILEFSNHLSGMGSLSLLYANEEMTKSLSFMLKHLQNTIGTVLETIGVNQKNLKRQCSYVCQKCDETLTGDSIINIWENHSHLDELLATALNNSGDSVEIEDEAEDELEDQTDDDNDHGLNKDINGFRFNFDVSYDNAIKQKIYPSLFLSTMKKFEKLDCYTLQRISPHRSTCLLCSCELMVRGKINQKSLVDHIVGQRHLNFTTSNLHLLALQEYHETFLSLEVPYQAHQVYFQPKLHRKTRCELCKMTVRTKLIRYHISSNVHKECFMRVMCGKEQEFYLTDYQAMVYADDHQISELIKLQKLQKANAELAKEDESKKNAAQPTIKPKRLAAAPTEAETLLHDIRVAVENPESSSILEQTPRRYEDHVKFLIEQEQKVVCVICRENMEKNVEKILQHFKQPLHKSLSIVPLKKFSYFCYVCNFKIFTEIQWRKHFREYYDRHVSKNPEMVYVEYECLICQLVFFGDSDQSIHHHVSQANNKKKKKKTVTKLPATVYKLFQSKAIIQEEGDQLTMEAEAVIKDELTLKCCEQVENVLKSTFNGCKVYPFGSRISGLGNKDSDLDMFLDSGGTYSGEKPISSHEQVLLVKKVYSILVKLKEKFSNVVEISTARTPIVKFKHIETNIDCDLSFKHGLSVENTKFLKFCLALQPIAQPFILILKSWSSFNCLNEKISTYALAILAIFYLQLNNYLLSIKEIRQLDQAHVQVIGGWETINYPKSIEEMRDTVRFYPHDICKLLQDFFSYYHSFPFDQDVVCPLLGTTIQKEQFIRDGKNGKSLPAEMKRYVDQLGSQEAEIFKAASPFCIQDPFDLSHNLAKACDKNLVTKFQCLCRLSLLHVNNLE